MTTSINLQDSVVLITGAGSGIGRASAIELSRHGAKVAVTEVPSRMPLAEKLVAELKQSGIDAMSLALDLRSTHTIPHVVDTVVRQYGALDILINNAGMQILKPALELEESEFDAIMDVNLKGAFFCSQAAAAVMLEQKRGCIINVASQHGVVGNRLRAPYCASKAGLINLTRALAVEWAEYGIRVNAISPTFVDNGQNGETLEQPDVRSEIERNILLGRPASVQDVAWGIYYLASPMSAMVTGHNLMIDGGWTAH